MFVELAKVDFLVEPDLRLAFLNPYKKKDFQGYAQFVDFGSRPSGDLRKNEPCNSDGNCSCSSKTKIKTASQWNGGAATAEIRYLQEACPDTPLRQVSVDHKRSDKAEHDSKKV